MANSEGDLIRVKDIEPAPIAEVIKFVNKRLPLDEVVAFADFIEPIFQLDPEKRPTASELLQHPWLERKE